MDSSSTAWGRVVVATAGVLVAGVVAASASIEGSPFRRGEVLGSSGGPVELAGGDEGGAGASTGSTSSTSTTATPTTVPPPPPPPSTSVEPAPPRRRAGAATSAASSSSDPGVRRPLSRPSRTSEAATQPEEPPPSPVPGPAAPPPSTARYAQDFPDPFVYRSGPFWYAVSTQRGWSKVPLIRSADLVHWEERGDGLAALPRWSRFGALWAPAVLPVDRGFVLFYATTEEATGLQCLSSAFAVLADGPFVDTSTGPLVCQRDQGGSIDPSPFRDAAWRPWLVWKSEGTLDGEPTRLWSQPLADDGRALAAGSAAQELLATALPWEGPIIEAPSMFVGPDGTYHLLYSGNRWETSAYGVGHARCAGPAGPCVRSSGAPVGSGHPSEAGAGGAEAFLDGSVWRVAYHAWDPSAVGYPGGLRRLRIGDLRVGEDGSVRVEPVPR